VTAHTADPSWSRIAGIAAPALAAAVAASPGRSAAANGDKLAKGPAPTSPVTADPDDGTALAASLSRGYIYGFDSAGNPTLTDADYYRSSGNKMPE
jgi:hypothetical protein